MTSEGYVGTRLHVLVRFGRWRDILDEPVPDDPDLYPVTIAMAHYARGPAYAFLKCPIMRIGSALLSMTALDGLPRTVGSSTIWL